MFLFFLYCAKQERSFVIILYKNKKELFLYNSSFLFKCK